VPDIKAQEAVRRSLYDMAANECAILAETLKAECSLSNIVIIAPITRGDDRVFVKESGRPKLDVIPHTLDDYASWDGRVQIVFSRDDKGWAKGLILYDEARGAEQATKLVLDDVLAPQR
jgi:hypothetical protein